jgi:Tfp pilus assembly protein PilV
MFKILNNKGISLVEVLAAAALAMIAIVTLTPMQDMSLKTGFKADYLGRATYIMQKELETREYVIMNQNITVTTTNSPHIVQAFTSDGALTTQSSSDAYFTVVTSIRLNPAATLNNSWIVNVKVSWPGGPGGPPKTISSSIIATKQLGF